MKSCLVIGMGRFGYHLALKMTELGNDVMVMDRDGDYINEIADHFTDAQIGDCTKESVLKSLDIPSFDICYVAIGDNLSTSLEITYLLKKLGANHVVTKIGNEHHAKFLLKCGADEVVYPEMDMAVKTAIKHNADNVFDYIELTPQLGIYEIPVPDDWVGQSIEGLNVRANYDLYILAVTANSKLTAMPRPNYVFKPNDRLTVLGDNEAVFALNK